MTSAGVQDPVASRSHRARPLLILPLAAIYVGICGFSASRLTLFWDDYEFLLVQFNEPLGSIVMGTNSHAGPLSRGALRVLSMIFGSWYPGYVMTNALLAFASVTCLSLALRPAVRDWALVLAGAIYLTSLGLLAQSAIAICLEWFLSLFLASLSAVALSRGNRTWPLFLGASYLAWSGLALPGSLMVASALLVTFRYSPAQLNMSKRKALTTAALLPLAGVLVTLAGAALARINPSPYYAAIVEQSGYVPLRQGLVEAFVSAVYLFTGYLVAPLSVTPLTTPGMMTTLTFIFPAYATAFWTFLGVAAASAGAAVLLRWRGSSEVRAIAMAAVMLSPAFAWSLMLAFARPELPLAERYQMVWLLPVCLFWALVLGPRKRLARPRPLVYTGIALLSATCLLGIARLPWTPSTAGDLDRARSESYLTQQAAIEACGSSTPLDPSPVIAPRLSRDDFCTVIVNLQQSSIAGRIFGVR